MITSIINCGLKHLSISIDFGVWIKVIFQAYDYISMLRLKWIHDEKNGTCQLWTIVEVRFRPWTYLIEGGHFSLWSAIIWCTLHLFCHTRRQPYLHGRFVIQSPSIWSAGRMPYQKTLDTADCVGDARGHMIRGREYFRVYILALIQLCLFEHWYAG